MVMITFDFSAEKLQSYILWITDSCSSCTPQTLSTALGHATYRHCDKAAVVGCTSAGLREESPSGCESDKRDAD